MSSRVVYVRPVRLACLAVKPSTDRTMQDVWSSFWATWADVVGDDTRPAMAFGVSHGQGQADWHAQDRYLAAVALQDCPNGALPAAFNGAHLLGGSYLRYRHLSSRGPISAPLKGMHDGISKEPSLAFDGDRPTLEIYMLDRGGARRDPVIELCVPVRPKMASCDVDVLDGSPARRAVA